MSKQELAQTNVLRSAFMVLKALGTIGRAEEPVLASELAELLDVSTPTAFRAAETLVVAGYAKRGPSDKGYLPSLEIVELAGDVVDNLGIRDPAREILAEAARAHGETVMMAIRDRGHVIFIDRMEGTKSLRFYCDLGRRLPLHAGAAGRCILANLDDEVHSAYIAREDLERMTPRTLVEPDQLLQDRRAIQDRGYAVSVDQVDWGVSAVGVPIINLRGEALAVITIANRTSQWRSRDIENRARLLREAAARIQRRSWPLWLSREGY